MHRRSATVSGTRLSVIVPALDEGAAIEATLRGVAAQLDAGDELIVVDGGSRDDTAVRATPFAHRVLAAAPGRARQMNAGAAGARGDWLWFLHADTDLHPGAAALLRRRLGDRDWGRFGVRLSGRHPMFRVIACLMNLRSRITGIATGDQGLFVRRTLFERLGGFPDQPLMEDIALARALRAHGRPLCLPVGLTTSSRRWEEHGIGRTIALMWRLRWAYWRGADPAELARRYRGNAA